MPYQDFIPADFPITGGEGDGFRDFVPESEVKPAFEKTEEREPKRDKPKVNVEELTKEDLEDLGIDTDEIDLDNIDID
jgi:hypothetical protein